jgi:hypothetical protein
VTVVFSSVVIVVVAVVAAAAAVAVAAVVVVVILVVSPRVYHVTRHNTHIRNILSTAPQLSITQKALGTLSEGGNVMPKLVGATIHN